MEENKISLSLQKLRQIRGTDSADFCVSNFPGFTSHKIGIDNEGNCCVLIFSNSNGRSTINKPCKDLFEPLLNMWNFSESSLCIKKLIFFTKGRWYDKITHKV